MTVNIRARREKDLPAAAALLEEVYYRDQYPVEGVADPFSWLTPQGLLAAWVATIDDVVIGHAMVTENDPSDPTVVASVNAWISKGGQPEQAAVIRRLFVGKAGLGKGIGQRLVLAAMQWAQQNNTRLVLDVMAVHAGAIRLYERLKWHRIGTAVHDNGAGESFECFFYASPGSVVQN